MEMQQRDDCEFMMYTFKVVPCTKGYRHDWSKCAYLHPGEDARRRDPRTYRYTSVRCPNFRNGSCINGDSCENSHGRYEWGLHPSYFRTKPCNSGTACTREVCFFAHTPEQIRTAYSLPAPLSNSGSALRPPTMRMNFAGMQVDQNVNQQQWVYPSHSTNSDVIGLQQSRADPSMNSRYDAISKRSQDFIEHSSMRSFNPKLSSATSVAAGPSNLSGSALRPPTMPSFNPKLSSATSVAAGPSNLSGSALRPPTMPSFNPKLSSATSVAAGPSNLSGSALRPPTMPSFNPKLSSATSVAAGPSNLSGSALRPPTMPSFNPKLSSATSVAAGPSNLSGWGSHDGKVDWSIPGDELNRRTKLYSSGLGNTSSIPTMAAPNVDDPDVSLSEELWLKSLLKDDDPTLDSDQ